MPSKTKVHIEVLPLNQMEVLKDRFGRVHDYLRISLTEQCNMQCTYCVPFDESIKGNKSYLSATEFLAITEAFLKLGIKKIRLTGGEPLLYKELPQLLTGLKGKVPELAISTNGLLLDKYWDNLLDAGIKSLNISLDTLNADAFKNLTNSKQFDRIFRNLCLALEKGFVVKINSVLLRGQNDNQVNDLVALSVEYPLSVRFIEFMPFHKNLWETGKVMSSKEIINRIEDKFVLNKIPDKPNDTDKKFQIQGGKGTIGFISTVTEPFCAGCNRLRLTSDGKLKNCLFATNEFDLATALRNKENLTDCIKRNLSEKHEKTGGQMLHASIENRSMIHIGG